jgi:hypothetical protein
VDSYCDEKLNIHLIAYQKNWTRENKEKRMLSLVCSPTAAIPGGDLFSPESGGEAARDTRGRRELCWCDTARAPGTRKAASREAPTIPCSPLRESLRPRPRARCSSLIPSASASLGPFPTPILLFELPLDFYVVN